MTPFFPAKNSFTIYLSKMSLMVKYRQRTLGLPKHLPSHYFGEVKNKRDFHSVRSHLICLKAYFPILKCVFFYTVNEALWGIEEL